MQRKEMLKMLDKLSNMYRSGYKNYISYLIAFWPLHFKVYFAIRKMKKKHPSCGLKQIPFLVWLRPVLLFIVFATFIAIKFDAFGFWLKDTHGSATSKHRNPVLEWLFIIGYYYIENRNEKIMLKHCIALRDDYIIVKNFPTKNLY